MQSVASSSIHTFSLSCLQPCEEKERCVQRNRALDEREEYLIAQSGRLDQAKADVIEMRQGIKRQREECE